MKRDWTQTTMAICAVMGAIFSVLSILWSGFTVLAKIDAFGVDLRALRTETETANTRQDKMLDDHELRIRELERAKR